MLRDFIERYFLNDVVDRARIGLGDGTAEHRLRTAVAVLLIETARMDATFGVEERKQIERILADRFSLSDDALSALMANAEKTVADTTQYFPFTHHINQEMSPEEKCEVIEMLWRVAYADGELDPHEDALIRQLAGLIHVTDRERAFARQRALQPTASSDSNKSD
jgi:uncharacterized tellurite resistance protein B-like protein